VGSLIDSSVHVAIERGDLDLERRLAETADEPFAISAITASELLHGVHRADDAARRAKREAWVEAILSSVPVLGFDLIAARVHARLAAALASNGTTVGAHDLIIGATALGRGLGVVTRDQRSFPRIPGLSVQVW
jgi:predicted nucleic acid-binding protein